MSSLAAFAADLLAGRIKVIDLTQTLSPDIPVVSLPAEFGQCAPFRLEEISRYDSRGPDWYWNNFTCGEHTGTHFDAPVHWISGKDLPQNTTDTIPPEHFIAPACVIDCSAEARADPDFLLTVDTLQAWEASHGTIPARAWVLLRTEWSKRRGAVFVNLHQDGAHTPGPDADAIRFLFEQRDILGLGVETMSTDAGQAHRFTPPYPAHSTMHGRGRYGLQCLCNLDRLPPTGALIVSPPLKIRGGSGSPLRVLALVAA
ncbi:Isatin hydrolase [Rhodovastum atsumiense]|uniref:Cyclase family protein n=1 Tax=Rhodovastum atsumiense TaxID=504468 RepID=A0A5M6IJU4_9PROT|nr:cyclase family protein [Rhodovastum atsumiense]KAA5608536.1 cyclase family protein [Rhodovastum atsumiense]CAH2599994.1 Isatin hydrolase [Rhodovastum atsumiense]